MPKNNTFELQAKLCLQYSVQSIDQLSLGFDHEYFEDEAIERLCKAAENAGANPNRIRKRHAVTSSLTGKSCLGGHIPHSGRDARRLVRGGWE